MVVGNFLAGPGAFCMGDYAADSWMANIFQILIDAPAKPFWTAFLLGAAYGFGGMSFEKAINHIGYSLTYTLAIGFGRHWHVRSGVSSFSFTDLGMLKWATSSLPVGCCTCRCSFFSATLLGF